MKIAENTYVFLTIGEVRAFVAQRRADAETLRRYCDERGAALAEAFTAELESFLRVKAEETVSVGDAAHATGFSADHLRRQLSTGELHNAGIPQKPAIRRSDLRPKRNKPLARENVESYDVAADVRALRIRRGE